MGRQPRIRLSALRQSESHRQVKVYQDSLTTPKFNTGDAVFALNFGRGATWVPATVVHVHSPHSFGVQVDDVVWKRHRDQLRPAGGAVWPSTRFVFCGPGGRTAAYTDQ